MWKLRQTFKWVNGCLKEKKSISCKIYTKFIYIVKHQLPNELEAVKKIILHSIIIYLIIVRLFLQYSVTYCYTLLQ